MNTTKTTLIQNSLNLLGDNPNHNFCAVTIRPYESFLHRFPCSTRTTITEEIIQNLIIKYDAHLISHTHKPKNQHLKIISHNAIETKTKVWFAQHIPSNLNDFCWLNWSTHGKLNLLFSALTPHFLLQDASSQKSRWRRFSWPHRFHWVQEHQTT